MISLMILDKKVVLLYACTLLTFTLNNHVFAQDTLIPVTFPLTYKNFPLAGVAEYAIADKDIEDLKTILAFSFAPLTKQVNGNYLQVPDSTASVLFRFQIRNELLQDTALVLKVNPPNNPMIL